MLSASPRVMASMQLSNSAAAQIADAEQRGDWATVVSLLADAQADCADNWQYWLRYGQAQRVSGDKVGALASLKKAHALDPDGTSVIQCVAETLCELGMRGQAGEWIARARKLQPESIELRYSEALIRIEQLDLPAAIDALRALLDVQPTHRSALSTLLYLLNLSAFDEDAVAQEHCRRAPLCYPAAESQHAVARQQGDQRGDRIRLGFISADFRDHPVGRFALPLFENLDRDRFELIAYSCGASVDAVAQRLRRATGRWRDALRLTDQELESQICDDQLDVLVDLSGHTQGHRLAVLARKPAPLLISWLGYPSTTGLNAIDFRIQDRIVAPRVQGQTGTETVLRLECSFACWRPASQLPPMRRHASDTFVFGSPHRLEKLGPEVLALWAKILHDCPLATLLLVRDQLDAPRQRVLAQDFARLGVDAQRLRMQQHSGDDHLQVYNQMDVMLDCFPWSGHTMACEALWMGVPVVTWQGPTSAGRLSASALHAAGCAGWVANDQEEYRRLAIELAAAGARSDTQRKSLREQICASTLSDTARFTSNFASLIELAMRKTRKA